MLYNTALQKLNDDHINLKYQLHFSPTDHDLVKQLSIIREFNRILDLLWCDYHLAPTLLNRDDHVHNLLHHHLLPTNRNKLPNRETHNRDQYLCHELAHSTDNRDNLHHYHIHHHLLCSRSNQLPSQDRLKDHRSPHNYNVLSSSVDDFHDLHYTHLHRGMHRSCMRRRIERHYSRFLIHYCLPHLACHLRPCCPNW